MKPNHIPNNEPAVRPPGHQGGFTLVEVTLAIGFVAIAMLVIIGLLPIGAQSGREAADYTIVANIASDLMDYRRTWPYDSAAPFPSSSSLISPRPGNYLMYFDQDGADVTTGLSNSYFKATYRVQANSAANMTNNTGTASVTLTIAWPLISGTANLVTNANTRTFYSEFTRLP